MAATIFGAGFIYEQMISMPLLHFAYRRTYYISRIFPEHTHFISFIRPLRDIILCAKCAPRRITFTSIWPHFDLTPPPGIYLFIPQAGCRVISRLFTAGVDFSPDTLSVYSHRVVLPPLYRQHLRDRHELPGATSIRPRRLLSAAATPDSIARHIKDELISMMLDIYRVAHFTTISSAFSDYIITRRHRVLYTYSTYTFLIYTRT
jgi:hypothetical protein